ncbi:ADP-ribosylglycohydrolase family protein [Micromonospora sp. NPDC051227]|uniref:ADP-ribosylglycohydrolase family protein n=1 Tax=Micromonospora sp. NPDC051227 TaxID=3364285 RepID=UPI00378A446F
MHGPRLTNLGDTAGSLAGSRGRAALLAAAAAEATSARLQERGAPTAAEITAALRRHDGSAPPGPHTASAMTLARRLSGSAGTVDVDALTAGLQTVGPVARTAVHVAEGTIANGSVGPAAWIWPVGLLTALPLEEVAALAGEIAVRCTTVALSQDTAVAHAVATALAARRMDIEPDVFVDAVAAHTVTPPLREAMRVTKMLLRARAEPEFVAAQFPTRRRSPRRCLASALTAFLLHPRDPVATVRTSLAQAGAVSEVAVMAAALAGAHTGERALPAAWRSRAARGPLARWPTPA